jgi:hypothetical protein
MRILALFGVLIGDGAMVIYSPPPIKMGKEWSRADAGHIFVTAPARAPGGARGRARHRRASLPVAPIINRFNPLIDGIVFGVLRQCRAFAADFRQYARVAKIKVQWRRSRFAIRPR